LLCVGVGNALLPCTGGRTPIGRGFAGIDNGYFIRFSVEYSGKPVFACIYTAAQTGLETIAGMAYYC